MDFWGWFHVFYAFMRLLIILSLHLLRRYFAISHSQGLPDCIVSIIAPAFRILCFFFLLWNFSNTKKNLLKEKGKGYTQTDMEGGRMSFLFSLFPYVLVISIHHWVKKERHLIEVAHDEWERKENDPVMM